MKIAFILESAAHCGGTLVILALARRLSQRGHHVFVVSRTSKPDWFPMNGISFLQLSDLNPTEFPEADVGVASFWTTMTPTAHSPRFSRALHLCQGYEGGIPIYEEQRESIEAAYNLPIPKLVISPHLKTLLESLFPHPVHHIGQAIFDEAFYDSPQAHTSPPPFRIALVGPFEAEFKGIPFILRTLKERASDLPIQVLHASPTPLSREERGLGVVHAYFQGLHPLEMGHLYRSCHFVIHAPLSCEGFPLPPSEGAACGCLPIVSDIPSYRTFPKELPTFEERDGAAMVDHLRHFIQNPEEMRARIRAVKAHVDKTLSLNAMVDALLAVASS